jgi:hypothetical protein
VSVEHAAASRRWVALPTTSSPRWYLPSTGGSVARKSLSVYRPVSLKALVGWRIARTGAQAGIFRMLPRTPIPEELQSALGSLRGLGEIAALARTNHSQRWIALILAPKGRYSIAKIALDEGGAARLDTEHENLMQFGGLLPEPLRAPRVVHYRYGALVMEAVTSRPRLSPSVLPERVASALGGFFSATRRTRSLPPTGLAHGDCAPWNLLRHENSWVLIDWESAATAQLPFLDLIHYHVSSYVELGRPSLSSLRAGFVGRGPISKVIQAYAANAGHPPSAAEGYFHLYVESGRLLALPEGGHECRPTARRRAERLVERVSP